MANTENRGGARQGAGRPRIVELARNRSIKLTDADWEKFRAVGGTKWLRELLKQIPAA